MAVPRERQKPRHRHKGADGLSARDHPCSRSRSESAKRHDDRRALLRRREPRGHAVRPRGRPAFNGESRKRAGEHERAQKREERPRRKRQRGEQGKLQNKVHNNTDNPEAPARGSCMISSFRSRGAQLASASEVSQSPSRWMPPVTATGSATSTAATMVAGTPSRFATCPHAVMRNPSARPTRGNAASAWVDPKSVQADFGTGMRENVPNAAPIASAIFTL